MVPRDYKVYRFNGTVKLKAGVNTLAFDGAGVSDGNGLIIDNVKLTSAFNSTNLILNGDFSSIPSVPGVFNYYNNGILNWWAAKAEVGNCRTVYNNLWPASSGNCIELDTDANQRYIQTITISQQLFNSLLVFMQTQIGVTTAQNNLNTAAGAAADRLNSAVARINDDILAQVKFVNKDFSQYLASLYSCVNEAVKGLHADQEIVLNQYGYLFDAWTSRFGNSNEVDFDDSYFNGIDLFNWSGKIHSINGKVITCIDGKGHSHYLQISPVTHFEG